MSRNINVVVLAAGKGTRLKLTTPKVLLPLCGRPLIAYLLDQIHKFLRTNQLKSIPTVIVGHGKDEVEQSIQEYSQHFEFPLKCLWQKEQLGTGHAVSTFFSQKLKDSEAMWTLVLCGDTPLILENELSEMLKFIEKNKVDVVVATFKAQNPNGYGRIVRTSSNKNKIKIVEHKNATSKILNINEVNSGLYLFKTDFLKNAIKKVKKDESSKEFYLTDVVEMAKKSKAVCFENEQNFLGINTLYQAEMAANVLRKRRIQYWQEAGVFFEMSETNLIDWNVQLSSGVHIYPGVILEGNTNVGPDVILGPGSILKNTRIESQAIIKAYTFAEDSVISTKATIGPFAHLRPGSEIGPESKVGNFVETKKAKLHKGVKISHLSYVGDAEIGEETNIGCGFITCNYDGKNKHFTKIGKKTFIGSDCQAIAPIEIGNESFVAAGSTLTQDVPDGCLALARTKQINKDGQAKKFLPQKQRK